MTKSKERLILWVDPQTGKSLTKKGKFLIMPARARRPGMGELCETYTYHLHIPANGFSSATSIRGKWSFVLLK